MKISIWIRAVLGALGPGLIIASVCLGPGSVTTASTIGAEYGYGLIWIVVLSSMAMMMYTVIGARFGATQSRSFLQAIADRYGRWFAVLIGIAAALMSGSFQFGNNLGVTTATSTVTDHWASRHLSALVGRPIPEEWIWPLLFTGSAFVLVLFAKNLYRVIEKLMIALVLTMIAAFFVNLLVARPDLAEAARGLVPSVPSDRDATMRMAAMVGTTFVLHACLYQSYLVQSKGWTLDDVKKSVRDSVVGIALLATISILVMMTSAATLRPQGVEIASAQEMALQLERFFGPWAKAIFCLGFWAAAFSSIPVNAIVGGSLLADGLGLGSKMGDPWARRFAQAIMLIGMLIAMTPQSNQAHALVVAQAATMLAVPAVGLGMFLIANDPAVMGRFRNSRGANVIAGFGLVLVIVVSFATYRKLLQAIEDARDAPPSTESASIDPDGNRALFRVARASGTVAGLKWVGVEEQSTARRCPSPPRSRGGWEGSCPIDGSTPLQSPRKRGEEGAGAWRSLATDLDSRDASNPPRRAAALLAESPPILSMRRRPSVSSLDGFPDIFQSRIRHETSLFPFVGTSSRPGTDGARLGLRIDAALRPARA